MDAIASKAAEMGHPRSIADANAQLSRASRREMREMARKPAAFDAKTSEGWLSW